MNNLNDANVDSNYCSVVFRPSNDIIHMTNSWKLVIMSSVFTIVRKVQMFMKKFFPIQVNLYQMTSSYVLSILAFYRNKVQITNAK